MLSQALKYFLCLRIGGSGQAGCVQLFLFDEFKDYATREEGKVEFY